MYWWLWLIILVVNNLLHFCSIHIKDSHTLLSCVFLHCIPRARCQGRSGVSVVLDSGTARAQTWSLVSWFRALSNSPLISTNKARHVGSSWPGCHLLPGVLAAVCRSLCQASPTLGKRGWSTRAYHGNARIRCPKDASSHTRISPLSHLLTLSSSWVPAVCVSLCCSTLIYTRTLYGHTHTHMLIYI